MGCDTTSPGLSHSRCKANDACQWYSYNRREEICYQFSSCPSLNSCATCVSGERNCDTNNAGESARVFQFLVTEDKLGLIHKMQ